MTTDDFPGDFKDLNDALVKTKSVEQFLHDLAVLAARVVGSELSCAMTMSSRPQPVTAACTDPVAAKMDAVQHELRTGPCLDAMREDRMVRIDDTAAEPRWPEFSRRAAAQGIRSCLALPLSSQRQPIGALNLYARDARAFGEAATKRAAGFAENASGALALAIRLASHAALIDQLRSSMASRAVIDQALGIIMANEHCSQARAFAILRSASQQRNVKLRDIASAIVTSVSGEPPQPPPAFEENLCRASSAPADDFPAAVSLGRPAIGVCLLAERPVIKDGFSIRAGERRRNAGVNIYQAIDAGQGQYPLHGWRGDDQAHFSAIGLGPPERAH